MKFIATPLPGAFILEAEPLTDERGFFARSFCRREFAAHGLCPDIAQCNVSYNRRAGTLRGMHFAHPPHQEAKTVSCIAGRIFDVIVDRRADSPTYGQWFSVELAEKSGQALYVPAGMAHGFQTLCDDTTVFYQMSQFYQADAGDGLRYDDPALAIRWPLAHPILSPRDAAWPLLAERGPGAERGA